MNTINAQDLGITVTEPKHWFNENVLTAFYYNNDSFHAMDYYNMYPNEFSESTHYAIVAVWHIKPKQLA